MVHCGEDKSVHERGVALEKTHLSPLHWQSGIEVFHEDKTRLSVLPCREALIFPKRSSTSEEVKGEAGDTDFGVVLVALQKQKKRKKKKDMGM